MNLENEILGLLLEALSEGEKAEINFETELIESEIMDSLVIAQMIAGMEERFQLEEIPIEDITKENFRTVEAMAALVKGYISRS